MRISVILLAAISAVLVWVMEIFTMPPPARNPMKSGVSVKCKNYDLGKWGPSRTQIKRTQCGSIGVTYVGKWKQHGRRT